MAELSKNGKVIGPAWRKASKYKPKHRWRDDAAASSWERELRRLNVREEAAAEEIRTRTAAGIALRRFVLSAAYRSFVPENVLEMLGIGAEVERVQDAWDPIRYRKSMRAVKMLREETAREQPLALSS